MTSLGHAPEAPAAPLHVIPCCYEFGPDLNRVSEQTGLRIEEIVQLHASTVYTVYAIGFCPGFPYLGYLPALIVWRPTSEHATPDRPGRQRWYDGSSDRHLHAGAPGGWNLIGRTPLELVNVADNYFPLLAGDRVQFQPISRSEFKKLSGRRLASRTG